MKTSDTGNPYHKEGDFGEGKISWNENPEFQAWEEGRQAGIKEVVEWIKSYKRDEISCDTWLIPNENWQSKLKSWNVKA